MEKVGKPLDFDVVRESWNKYQLNDNSILKTKYVLERLFKIVKEDGKPEYRIDGKILTVIIVPENLKGLPDTAVYTKEAYQTAIIQDDVRYTTLAEEWNEYIVDDGTRLRIKTTVSHVAKTSKYDKNGDPVYMVDNSALVQVRLPKIN